VSAAADFRLALADLGAALVELAVPSAIIGGVAAMARGVERATADVDATIAGEGVDARRVLAVFAAHGIEPRLGDALGLLARSHVLLLVHTASGTPVDLVFGFLPFELEALANASEVDFAGVPLRVVSAEDLVIYKAVAWRPIDRDDIERLLARWGDRIDLARVRTWLGQFASALEEPGRLAEFEALERRARGA